MKFLFLILLLAIGPFAWAQEKPLTESEKEKLRIYWRQHWPEKVRVEVLKVYPTVVMIRISNELPYNISKYHINLQWYTAAGKPVTTAYKEGGKMIYPYSSVEGYVKANTVQETGLAKVPGAATLKASMGFVEIPKIGMKQDSL